MPHLARFVVGPDHRRLLPMAALVGAAFMLGVDDIARSAPSQELPVGLLTALIGTPAFEPRRVCRRLFCLSYAAIGTVRPMTR